MSITQIKKLRSDFDRIFRSRSGSKNVKPVRFGHILTLWSIDTQISKTGAIKCQIWRL